MKKKVYAKSKYIRMSPQKTRLVVDMIRGEKAEYAAEMLNFVNKAAALPVKKTIESAIANAEFNEDMDKTELEIVEARVDEAPIYKRGRAVSKGRYHKILKRNCHIVIAVSDNKDVKKATKKKVVTKAVPKKVAAKKKDLKNKPEQKKKNVQQDMVKSHQVQNVPAAPRKVQSKG